MSEDARGPLAELPAGSRSGQQLRPEPGCEILLLSGPDPGGLRQAANELAGWLRAADAPPLAAVCAALAACSDRLPHRLAIVAASRREAADKLAAFAATGHEQEGAFAGQERPEGLMPAFLFTGQGSQYGGMGAQLYAAEPVYRAAIDQCARILAPVLDTALTDLLFGADADQLLKRTSQAQPALVAVAFALAELWRSRGLRPAIVAGHSIGELAAATVAGVLAIDDALPLAALRGRLMQELPGGGAMMALAADSATVRELIAQNGINADIAADNGPAETVASGPSAALARLREAALERRIACIDLGASHAFHSRLMEPMLERFGEAAARIIMHAPRIPIVSGLTGQLADGAAVARADYWVAQIRQTVRFREALLSCLAAGCRTMIEIGPRPVLLGLARAALGARAPLLLPSMEPGRDAQRCMLGSLGALASQGLNLSGKEKPGSAPHDLPRPPRRTDQRQGEQPGPGDAAVRPASLTEQSFLLADQLHPIAGQYNISVAVRVPGWPDLAALDRAVRALGHRHAALRSTFAWATSTHQVSIGPGGTGQLAVHAMTGLSQAAQQALVQASHDKPFRPTEEPPWRIGLFLDQRAHVLCMTAHHAIADLAALVAALADLQALYQAEVRQEVADLPPPRGGADLLERERQLTCGPNAERARAFWSEKLAQLPPPIKWPAIPASPGARGPVRFQLTPELLGQLHAFCRSQRVNLHAVLLASWLELIARYSGDRDWLVGIPASFRTRELADAVACAVAMLPVRLRAPGEEDFRQAAARVHADVASSLFNRLPTQDILGCAALSTSRRGSAPYQLLVVLRQRPGAGNGPAGTAWGSGADGSIGWADAGAQAWPLDQQQESVDLTLELVEAGNAYECAVSGARGVVHPALMLELARALPNFLAEAMARPDLAMQRICRSEAVLLPGRTSGLGPDRSRDLVARFLDLAATSGEAEAVRDGERTMSYAELEQCSRALALKLVAAGVKPGDRVGVCLPPAMAAVVAKLAAMRAGASFLPIGHDLPAARVAAIVSAAQCRVAIAGHATRPLLPQDVICLDAPVSADDSAGEAAVAGDAVLPTQDQRTRGYTLFTSGTTGVPKGVDVGQAALAAMVDAVNEVVGAGADELWTWFHSSSFDISIWEIFGCLATGGTLVIVPESARGAPDQLFDFLTREQARIVALTPTALSLLADECDRRGAGRLSVRDLLICGEALPGKLAARMIDRVGNLWNLYGVAEATVYSTLVRVDRMEAAFATVPLGPALASAAVRLVDASGFDVPRYAEGEIELAGPALADGYVEGDPTGKFAAAPDLPGGRRYRTGDLAMWDGERLHFHGRRDLMVKLRGHRIELREIENVLRACDGVTDSAVIVEPSAAADRLIAFVVIQPAALFQEQSLSQQLARSLPSYMIPARIVRLQALPQTANGKLDRRALALLAVPAKPAAAADTDQAMIDRVAAVWREVLGASAVDPDCPFFELGGNSLRLMRVFETIRHWPEGRALVPSDLFNFPTIRALSNHLTRAADGLRADHSAEPIGPTPGKLRPGGGKIAIVGLEMRAPGAPDTAAFIDLLRSGGTLERLSGDASPCAMLDQPGYVAVENRLQRRAWFDPWYFGLTKPEADLIDPQHRVMLLLVRELLERLGRAGSDDLRTGLFLSASFNTYLTNVLKPGNCDLFSLTGTQVMLGNDKDYMPGRIAYALGLTGPALAVQSGCSSSLVAVHMAVRALQAGDCGLALAGGVSIHAQDYPGYLFTPDLMFSPDGQCRAFSADAAGTPFADGAGLVALRRLEDALADGDQILGVIAGSSSNNDGGERAGFAAPGVSGQRTLIEEALRESGIAAGAIGFVEAHGTGTRLGDMIELSALTQAYGGSGPGGAQALGTVKASFGHMAAAAGVAGLISATLAVRDGVLPQHPGFASDDEAAAIPGTPFFVNTGQAAWPVSGQRRAAVSSFGLGGSNAHIVLEQAPPRGSEAEAHEAAESWYAAPVSAARAAALGPLVAATADRIDTGLPAEAVAATLQWGRRHRGWRCIALGRTAHELAAGLRLAASAAAAGKVASAITLTSGQNANYDWLKQVAAERDPGLAELIKALPVGWPGILQALDGAASDPAARCAAHIAAINWLRQKIGGELSLAGRDPQAAAACAFLRGEIGFADAVAARIDPDPETPGHALVIDLQAREVRPAGKGAAIPAAALPAEAPWGLVALAQAWVAGADIAWPVPARRGPRAELPSESLELIPCWAEPGPAVPQQPAEDMTDRCWHEQWKRLHRLMPGEKPAADRGRTLVVVAAATPDAQVISALQSAGAGLQQASAGVGIDPDTETVVFLPARADAGVEQLGAANALLEFVRSALASPRKVALAIVVPGAFDVLGGETISPDMAALAAAANVIAQELPWLSVRVIDPGSALLTEPAQIVSELLRRDGEAVCAIRNGCLWTREFAPLPAASTSAPRLAAGDVLLVVGGLGSIGFAVGHHLARRFGLRLALLGRRSKDQVEADHLGAERIGLLDRDGIAHVYEQADAGDIAQLKAALTRIEMELGPVRGFVEAAGEAAPASGHWIVESTRSAFDHCVSAKLGPALNLQALLPPGEVALGVFTSSLSVVLGGQGLAAYAAAHAFVDALCLAPAARGRYLAIGWDDWQTREPGSQETQASPQRQAQHRQALTADRAVQLLDLALAQIGEGRVFATHRDLALAAQAQADLARGALLSADALAASGPLSAPLAGESDPRGMLRLLWRAHTTAQGEEIEDFFLAGGNSLRAVALSSAINSAFAADVRPQDIFAVRTFSGVLALIEGSGPTASEPADLRGNRRREARSRRRSQPRKPNASLRT